MGAINITYKKYMPFNAICLMLQGARNGFVLYWIVSMISGAAMAGGGYGKGFALQGSWRQNVISGMTEIYTEGLFSVKYDGGAWQVASRFKKNNVEMEVIAFSTNGTEVMQFTYMHGHTNIRSLPARVFSAPLPVDGRGTCIDVIWYVYASIKYLNESTNNMLCPNYDILVHPMIALDYKLPCLVARTGKDPDFVKEIIFINSGHAVSYDQERKEIIRYPLIYPYNAGYHDAKISVLSYTNIGGVSYPFVSMFEHYKPSPTGKSTNDLRAVRTAMLTLHNATTSSDALIELVPVVTNPLAVIDFRLLQSEGVKRPVAMVTVEGKWPSKEDSKQKAAKKNPEGFKARVSFAYIALLSILIVNIMMLRYKWKK